MFTLFHKLRAHLKMLNNYICALDIGSSKIAAAVAQLKRKRITNIFLESVPAKGIKKGVIVDSINLVGSVSRVLKNLKAKSAINIKSVYANISGQDLVTKHSRAIMPLAERGNKVITPADIEKVNAQARILGASLEEEIIHAIPFSYTIDSQNNILNPLGLYSHRLEVDLYLVCAWASSIQSLTHVINQAGYEIKDLFFSGIATSRVAFNKETSEGINILCDIGSDLTELLVFNHGSLIEIKILDLGGNDLTEELSLGLKIPFDLAEDLKRSYGALGDYGQIKDDKEILLKKNNVYKPIKQRVVSEILTSKAKLICQAIKDSLEKTVTFEEVNNFLTAGRTILQEGFLENLENTLGVSVKTARIVEPQIISKAFENPQLFGQSYLTYLGSLGVVCCALKEEPPQFLSAPKSTYNPILKAINKFKEVYQEYF